MKKGKVSDFFGKTTVNPSEDSYEMLLSQIFSKALYVLEDQYPIGEIDEDILCECLDISLAEIGYEELSLNDYDKIIHDMKITVEANAQLKEMAKNSGEPIKPTSILELEVPDYEYQEEVDAFEYALYELALEHDVHTKVTKKQIFDILHPKKDQWVLTNMDINRIANDVKEAVNDFVTPKPKTVKVDLKTKAKKLPATKVTAKTIQVEIKEHKKAIAILEKKLKEQFGIEPESKSKSQESDGFYELKKEVMGAIDRNDDWDDDCPDKEELNYEFLEFHANDLNKEWEFNLPEDEVDNVILELSYDYNIPTPYDSELVIATKIAHAYVESIRKIQPEYNIENHNIVSAMYHAECVMGKELDGTVLHNMRNSLNEEYGTDSWGDIREQLDAKEKVEKVKKMKTTNIHQFPEKEEKEDETEYGGVLL